MFKQELVLQYCECYFISSKYKFIHDLCPEEEKLISSQYATKQKYLTEGTANI